MLHFYLNSLSLELKMKQKYSPKQSKSLKLTLICHNEKKIPKKMVQKIINLILIKLKLIHNSLEFHLLLLSIFFKLPHFCYEIFV